MKSLHRTCLYEEKDRIHRTCLYEEFEDMKRIQFEENT